MLSQTHKKGLFINQVTEVLTATGEGVLKEQAAIARTYYNRRTGALIRGLNSNAFQVTNRYVNPSLVINYPIHIRFLDMKLTARGRIKQNWYQIYNKPLYGFIFGYAYRRLRYGLVDAIRDNYTGPLQTALKDPIWV
nr:hypothetical protein [uncultured Carboxylicivirga sp.]